MKNILVIEDEQSVADFVKKGLTEEGYSVQVAYDGAMGLELLKQHEADLVILDLILPGINGLEVCQKIRQSPNSHLPILMLTALSSTDNVIKGLDCGADDYLAKPFKFKELLARIRALLRRGENNHDSERILRLADLELDQDSKLARRNGHEIRLTSTEYRLLEYFLINRNKVLSRTDLLENVWSINFDMGTNVVDVYVNYLRNKIDNGFETKLIHTVIGMGYILKEQGH